MGSKWMWVKLLLVFVLLESNYWGSEGCWEQERRALLQLKNAFNDSGNLQNWAEGEEKIDCCQWEGVNCNNVTGRVIGLNIDLFDAWNSDSGKRSLNSSLLSPFKELKFFNLSGNITAGGSDQKPALLNLPNLEDLVLEGSSLNISFLQSIGSSLQFLRLTSCELNGFSHFEGFLNFTKLEYLDMEGTALNKKFFEIVRPMTSLKVLRLSRCGLKGMLADLKGLCEMVNLEDLSIDHNDLEGNLPDCLANLTSLAQFDISYNHMTGDISLSPLRYLTSMVFLTLSNNHFQIPIGLGPFYNLSRLGNFFGENNQIYLDTESHSFSPKFQLSEIILPGPGNGGKFPKFLYYQNDLTIVDLSHINFQGEFPNWLIENNTHLRSLHLVNDSISGPFQLPVHPHMKLESLDISNNFLHGKIPTEIGAIFPMLSYLNVSRNALNGTIPSSFGDMMSMDNLDLSENQLFGEIPEHLAMGCFQLEILVLSNNNLQGHIFSKSCNLTNLLWLQLDGNDFVGKIPDCLSQSPRIQGIYLSDNYLSGTIPGWLGNLSGVYDIMVPNNHLKGPIPVEFCQYDSLEILDLSENNISGILPSCFNPLGLKQLHLSKNMLQGQLNDATLYNSSSLETLDLSYNNVNGIIPEWIDKLSQLRYLILAKNKFEGDLTNQLCQLKKLRLLDLSHNNFSGPIPACLDNTSLNEGYYEAPTPMPKVFPSPDPGRPMGKEESVAFTTKEMSYTYHGRPLESMYGIDLSSNKLTGEIPPQIGKLTRIRALNLSYNNLTGIIPETFSNLKQVESLDLSYNNLNGKCPSELVRLYSLAVFSVAHNNLSGKVPDRVAQFATFNESSYEGNPLLCGQPLSNSCNEIGYPSLLPTASIDSEEEDNNLIDMDSFYITFTVSYVIVLLGIFLVLYMNPYWRRRWFYLVETWMTSCYYFVVDYLPKRFRH